MCRFPQNVHTLSALGQGIICNCECLSFLIPGVKVYVLQSAQRGVGGCRMHVLGARNADGQTANRQPDKVHKNLKKKLNQNSMKYDAMAKVRRQLCIVIYRHVLLDNF